MMVYRRYKEKPWLKHKRRLAWRYERRTMVIATMVVVWDALVKAGTVVATLALLLLGLVTILNGLVALLSNWTVLVDHW